MSTKRQLRSENIKEKKLKKSTRMIYLAVILGGGFIVLVIFFVILFSAIFPPVDMDAMKKKEKYVVKIYFSDEKERFLKPEKRYVFKEKDTGEQAKEIVKAVLDGSKTGLVDTFPKKVAVRDVKVTDDGIAEVSFSKELMKAYEGSSASEMATIYSVTNSVSQNIPAIKKVKFLVEGKEIPTIKGHISTRMAFSPDLELIIPEKTE
jgi:hypothetical protein